MTEDAFSFDDVQRQCGQLANVYLTRRQGYQPTTNQVLFFTLSWMRKKKFLNQIDRVWEVLIDRNALTSHSKKVAFHLDGEDGEIITKLKQKDELEWGSLLKQLKIRLNNPQNISDAAISTSLFQLFVMLTRMIDGTVIDQTADVPTFVMGLPIASIKTYDFRGPFQAYAFTVAKNAIIKLSQGSKQDQKTYSLLEDLDILHDPISMLFENEEEHEKQIKQLTSQLPELFAQIEILTPKRRMVAGYTLAARQQFWLAISLTHTIVPDWYPQKSLLFTDAEIGSALGMSENSVRANRKYAYEDIKRTAPELSDLYLTLTNVYY